MPFWCGGGSEWCGEGVPWCGVDTFILDDAVFGLLDKNYNPLL